MPLRKSLKSVGFRRTSAALPLALELAGAYIEECAVPFFNYRARLAATPLHGLEPVAKNLTLSLDQLSPAAVTLLERLSYLAPDAIPRTLLEGWDWADVELDAVIAALRRYSLVTAEDGSLSVHRLLQQVVRSRISDPAAVCGTVLRHMDDRFLFDYEKIETWAPADPLYEHAVAVALHAADLEVELERTSRLLNQAGLLAWYRRADLPAALRLLQRALAINEKTLGPDHPKVAIRASNIGQILQDQGDLVGALSNSRRALAIWEKVLGTDHPQVAIGANNIGSILKAQGNLDGALSSTRRALAIWEETLGPDHPKVAIRANNIGMILKDQDDLDGALSYSSRALLIDEKSFGPDHPNVARDANNIGMILKAQGDLEGALSYTHRALAIRTKFLGPEHPNIRAAAGNLAEIERQIARKP